MGTRRRFLKSVGLGASSVLLGPLLTKIAMADEHQTPPRRFFFVVDGNGFEPVTMLSQTARMALNSSLASPLVNERWWHRRYRHDSVLVAPNRLESAPALTGLGDLTGRSAVVLGLSSKITGGGHSAKHGVLSSARSSGGPGGISLDAWLSERPQVRRETAFDAIRLGVGSDSSRSLDFGTCAYGLGRPAPMMLKPEQAFLALFGSISGGAVAEAFGRRGAQLDFAVRDVRASIQEFTGSAIERGKLQGYLAGLESQRLLRERIVGLEAQLRAAQPQAPENGASALGRFQQNLDIAATAMVSGLTNVCVVGCGTGGDFSLTYPEVLRGVARHDLHHESGGNPQFLAAIHEVTRLQVEAIAGVARRFQQTPDGEGGTMLDNTVIVFIGDNGEQHHSTASDFPVLMIGGEGLGLNTGGRTLIYPGLSSDGHRQVSNLWNTLGYACGEQLDGFGKEGPTRRAFGPLQELLAGG